MDPAGRSSRINHVPSSTFLLKLSSLVVKVGAVALASGLTCKLLGLPRIVMISATGLAFLYFAARTITHKAPSIPKKILPPPVPPVPKEIKTQADHNALMTRIDWEQSQGDKLPKRSKVEQDTRLNLLTQDMEFMSQQGEALSSKGGSKPATPSLVGSAVSFHEATKKRAATEKQKFEEREAIRIENDKTLEGKFKNFFGDLGI